MRLVISDGCNVLRMLRTRRVALASMRSVISDGCNTHLRGDTNRNTSLQGGPSFLTGGATCHRLFSGPHHHGASMTPVISDGCNW